MATNAKFLIIDSKTTRRHSIQNLFFSLEYETSDVQGVASAEVGLELAKSKHYVAAFISTAEAYDWVDLIRSMRATHDFNALPIIVISETPTKEKVLSAYDAGCNGFLRYPCTEVEIAKTIQVLENEPEQSPNKKRITI